MPTSSELLAEDLALFRKTFPLNSYQMLAAAVEELARLISTPKYRQERSGMAKINVIHRDFLEIARTMMSLHTFPDMHETAEPTSEEITAIVDKEEEASLKKFRDILQTATHTPFSITKSTTSELTERLDELFKFVNKNLYLALTRNAIISDLSHAIRRIQAHEALMLKINNNLATLKTFSDAQINSTHAASKQLAITLQKAFEETDFSKIHYALMSNDEGEIGTTAFLTALDDIFSKVALLTSSANDVPPRLEYSDIIADTAALLERIPEPGDQRVKSKAEKKAEKEELLAITNRLKDVAAVLAEKKTLSAENEALLQTTIVALKKEDTSKKAPKETVEEKIRRLDKMVTALEEASFEEVRQPLKTFLATLVHATKEQLYHYASEDVYTEVSKSADIQKDAIFREKFVAFSEALIRLTRKIDPSYSDSLHEKIIAIAILFEKTRQAHPNNIILSINPTELEDRLNAASLALQDAVKDTNTFTAEDVNAVNEFVLISSQMTDLINKKQFEQKLAELRAVATAKAEQSDESPFHLLAEAHQWLNSATTSGDKISPQLLAAANKVLGTITCERAPDGRITGHITFYTGANSESEEESAKKKPTFHEALDELMTAAKKAPGGPSENTQAVLLLVGGFVLLGLAFLTLLACTVAPVGLFVANVAACCSLTTPTLAGIGYGASVGYLGVVALTRACGVFKATGTSEKLLKAGKCLEDYQAAAAPAA
jgi:hypothetical protein